MENTLKPDNELEARFRELIEGEFREPFEKLMRERDVEGEARLKNLEPVIQALCERLGASEEELPDKIGKSQASRAERLTSLKAQIEETKRAYPDFDIARERENETFKALVQAGADVTSAYELAHKDEIMSAAMAYAARRAASATAENIRSRSARPMENALSSQAASFVKPRGVDNMSREERDALIKRAMMGERIVL